MPSYPYDQIRRAPDTTKATDALSEGLRRACWELDEDLRECARRRRHDRDDPMHRSIDGDPRLGRRLHRSRGRHDLTKARLGERPNTTPRTLRSVAG